MENKSLEKINSKNALYIKLGPKGDWEKECLSNGTIRLGYIETPYELAASGKWDEVHKFWSELRGNSKTASQDLTQIRHFFESPKDTVWITFHGGYLYWCFAEEEVKQQIDGNGFVRETVDGWHKTDVNGDKLTTDKLSGNLLKVQGFRGTVCHVQASDYLIRRINGEYLPEVAAAKQAEECMIECVVPLLGLLTWQDFELLVELVFAQSGWRRIGQLGKTQKTVDIELELPTTGERAFVQIKSSTSDKELDDYIERHAGSDAYNRMFFVWHTGKTTRAENDHVVLIGPERLARLIFEAGLTSWLRKKVS